MLIVLPPSETKAPGGSPGPMAVSFSALDSVRASLLDDLAALPLDEMVSLLKIPPSKRDEAEENRSLRAAPVMPAIVRYTGVLYDALSPASLPPAALSRLAIGSALFGIVRATDLIPRYRLSGSAKVPARDGSLPTMKARWGSLVTAALEQEGFVVDLRSGTYAQLGRVPGAVTVRVESVQGDGSRKVVSHFNKHYKGELARALALGPSCSSVAEVVESARDAGFSVEVSGTQLTLVV
ncbi:peroxide stress protein YaaA [Corynebacterium liangguodongii]|uniref:Peroxide stress protein YaaA n=1 Tax=Corynebacterium liangguodongii TaxID=2079535 RepID=A0A2S0WH51_9CORY|nr:peroxide stress protein YaaA [Corynebacterium liangguodongii]AWB85093.1 peroxide stress protein YaaA [Corynebacterium liangguodongii]PWC00331.1 peroxide stress protein YaaA [Corynebacterium liangguodongii]